jgi:hypothetical protein
VEAFHHSRDKPGMRFEDLQLIDKDASKSLLGDSCFVVLASVIVSVIGLIFTVDFIRSVVVAVIMVALAVRARGVIDPVVCCGIREFKGFEIVVRKPWPSLTLSPCSWTPLASILHTEP